MKLLDVRGLTYFWEKMRSALDGKQDRLTGSPGQIAGFDENGRAAAVDPEYVTAQQMASAIAEAVTGAMEEEY